MKAPLFPIPLFRQDFTSDGLKRVAAGFPVSLLLCGLRRISSYRAKLPAFASHLTANHVTLDFSLLSFCAFVSLHVENWDNSCSYSAGYSKN